MQELRAKSANYSARIVRLTKFQDIPGADRIQHAIILGQYIIVSKDCFRMRWRLIAICIGIQRSAMWIH